MKEYISSQWQEVLAYHKLDQFGSLWDVDVPLFEEPNYRRGGWSGVAQVELTLPLGGAVSFFLKRQENHVFRTLAHPLRGQATYFREFMNIRHFEACGIPTLDVAYFGQRLVNGKLQAILMTRDLEGFCPLDSDTLKKQMDIGQPLGRKRKSALLVGLAKVIRELHEHRLMHNNLYPKHIFCRIPEAGEVEIRLIDLENVKKVWRRSTAVMRDLDSLNRRHEDVSRGDRLQFLKCYLQQDHKNSKLKRLWYRLEARKQQKVMK